MGRRWTAVQGDRFGYGDGGGGPGIGRADYRRGASPVAGIGKGKRSDLAEESAGSGNSAIGPRRRSVLLDRAVRRGVSGIHERCAAADSRARHGDFFVNFAEDDLLPLSGLQHLVFCERQWGLIHIEQQWEENRLPSEGRILHERVHEAGTEARPGVVTARGLHLRSFQLGLSGQAGVMARFGEAVELLESLGAKITEV